MFFEKECIYHIYNRSNEKIFYSNDNYIYFLWKVRDHILPCSDILAYCLMPNHFHFLLKVNDLGTTKLEKSTKQFVQKLSQGIGTLTSSYTQGVNKELNRKGSLFAHRTQAKMINDAKNDYLLRSFIYIHQNPVNDGLVDKLDDWEFSSYYDYTAKRKGTLVNTKLGLDLLNIDPNDIEFILNNFSRDLGDIPF